MANHENRIPEFYNNVSSIRDMIKYFPKKLLDNDKLMLSWRASAYGTVCIKVRGESDTYDYANIVALGDGRFKIYLYKDSNCNEDPNVINAHFSNKRSNEEVSNEIINILTIHGHFKVD